MNLSASVRILIAGAERLRLASERGLTGDDPALPIREARYDSGAKTRIVWIGPVEPGGEDRNLWELDAEI